MNTHHLPRAVGVGLLAALAMFVVIMLGIHALGVAPFNMPPSAAFLETLGLNVGPLAAVVHFGYGAFWSALLVAIYGRSTDLSKGLFLGTGLWLVMMLVHSPLIGWGLFGLQGTPNLAEDAALFLEGGPKYAVLTLVLHLLYGAIVGTLNGS